MIKVNNLSGWKAYYYHAVTNLEKTYWRIYFMSKQLMKGKNVIFNAHVFYAKLKNPALKYGKKPNGTPHGNREYTVDVLVQEDTYKLLKKKYKNVKSIKDAKEYTASEFEAQFKVAPPFEAEEYIVIKFKKSADYKDGNATPKPIVRAAKGCTKPVSIDTEIGNGSKAHVQWKEREWVYEGKKGLSLDLAAIGVTDLIEYRGGEPDLEFDVEDEVEFDDIDDDADTDDADTGKTEEPESSDDDEDGDEGW